MNLELPRCFDKTICFLKIYTRCWLFPNLQQSTSTKIIGLILLLMLCLSWKRSAKSQYNGPQIQSLGLISFTNSLANRHSSSKWCRQMLNPSHTSTSQPISKRIENPIYTDVISSQFMGLFIFPLQKRWSYDKLRRRLKGEKSLNLPSW